MNKILMKCNDEKTFEILRILHNKFDISIL